MKYVKFVAETDFEWTKDFYVDAFDDDVSDEELTSLADEYARSSFK